MAASELRTCYLQQQSLIRTMGNVSKRHIIFYYTSSPMNISFGSFLYFKHLLKVKYFFPLKYGRDKNVHWFPLICLLNN